MFRASNYYYFVNVIWQFENLDHCSLTVSSVSSVPFHVAIRKEVSFFEINFVCMLSLHLSIFEKVYGDNYLIAQEQLRDPFTLSGKSAEIKIKNHCKSEEGAVP